MFINYKKSCFSLSIALLLLIQIVSSSANLLDEYSIEDDVFLVEGNEFVVSFDHVISPVDWEYIEGLGAVPLRLKEHREMIVWYEGVGDSLHGNGIVGVEVEGGAPFLGDVNYFGNVKLLFFFGTNSIFQAPETTSRKHCILKVDLYISGLEMQENQ